MGLPLNGLIMFDFMEYLRHNMTGILITDGYVEIVWEDIDGQYDDIGGGVFVRGKFSYWAY